MNNSGSPNASLVIQFGPSKDSCGVLEHLLQNGDRLPGCPTLIFPLAWIEQNRKVNPPFPRLTKEGIEKFYSAIENEIFRYAPLGYSGAPEQELSGNLLAFDRDMVAKNLSDLSLFPSNNGPPIIWPRQPDFFRPWPHDSTTGNYCLIGFSGTTDHKIGVLQTPDLRPKKILLAPFPPTVSKKVQNNQVFLWEISDIESLDRGFDFFSWVNKQELRWDTLSKVISEADGWNGGTLESILFTPGWRDHPCRTHVIFCESSKQKMSRQSLFQQLGAFSRSCALESLPHKNPPSSPDRELVASMLGSATLVGETLEATFEEGLLIQMRGTFGGTRGMGVRSPGMIIENRKLYWTIESAFSFETQKSRGLRQISVLTSELFTLGGRAVTDYIFYDNHPGLVVDIRIQYPWIEKSFTVERFLPWTLEIWQYAQDRAPTVSQILPESSQPYPTQGYFKKPEKNSSWLSNVLGYRRNLPMAQLSIPGSAWDIPCQEGNLRIRRAETLLYPEMVLPGSFFLQHHRDTLSLTLCPTRNYSSISSTSLQGIHEHFALVIYDPEFEKDIKVILDRELRTQVYPPWMVRG
ncbi:MAG: hypothetical protein GW949_07165 [Spirochaetales bacterium]|nr:hypothetical protein [Spirochaetales bacterium]